MSETNLTAIWDMLSEAYQEQAITDCLHTMFANGEWGKIDTMLAPILEIRGHVKFKANALAIGVKCAVRSRNLALALERFDVLSALGTDIDIIRHRVNALWELAIHMLPDNASVIFKLWEPLLADNLPLSVQKQFGMVGFLLIDAYRKNRDQKHEQSARQAMKMRLNRDIVDKLAIQYCR